MICPNCQTVNSKGSKFCQNCGSPILPVPDGFVEPQTPPPVKGRLESIKEVSEMARKGEITLDEFANFLSTISNVLAIKAEEIVELIEENQYAQQAPQEVEAGFKGMDLYEQGLAALMLFLSSGDPVNLDEGLQMIEAGNEYINQAMNLNQQASQNLQWDIML